MWGSIMKAKDFFETFDCFFSDIDEIFIHIEHRTEIIIPIESYFETIHTIDWTNYRIDFWTINKKVLEIVAVEI